MDLSLFTGHTQREEEQEDDESVKEKELESPFELFPHLVWLRISSQVKVSQDWLNMQSTSSKLMGLLEVYKINRMFPLVAPLLCKYLERKDVLNLCGSNKTIASSIVDHAQSKCLDPSWNREPWPFEDVYYEDMDEIRTSAYSLLVDMECEEKIKVLTIELLEAGSDFLIPFGFRFGDCYMEGVQYWESVNTFLQLFGRQIWFYNIKYFFNDEHPDVDILQITTQCLALTSNVMRIGIVYGNFNPFFLGHLPRYPHLSKLKIVLLEGDHQEVFVDFLRIHAEQLESLMIVGDPTHEETFPYKKLNVLHTENWSDLEPGRFTLKSFVQAPLSKLFMHITASNYAEFGQVFVEFNHFGGTLVALEFLLDIIPRNENENQYNSMEWAGKIHLPKLEAWNYGGGLGFLKQIPSLQHLLFYDSKFVNDGIILLDWEKKDVLSSNIWTHLKNLQTVEFLKSGDGRKTLLYSRQQHNQYQENQHINQPNKLNTNDYN